MKSDIFEVTLLSFGFIRHMHLSFLLWNFPVNNFFIKRQKLLKISNDKNKHLFLCYKNTPIIFFGIINWRKHQPEKVNKFLSMIENPQPETVIEEVKLKFFVSKIPVWDYFNISKSVFKSYLIEKSITCLRNIILDFMTSIVGQVTFIYCYLLNFC